MKGVVFYASKYGSTAQCTKWIAETTGLPVFDIKGYISDLSNFDFFVLDNPIIYYKLLNRKWLRKHWSILENKPIILFTVSGAPAGEKLNDWIANSDLPNELISKMKHFALRGRQIPKELTLYDRIMLKIGGLKNPDPIARKEELYGFDYMDNLVLHLFCAL